MAKSTNSRERANATFTIWTDSAYFGSVRSACRLSLVTFAGFDARPFRNRSSRLRVTSRAISGAVRRFLIFRNTFGSASMFRIATQRAGRFREARRWRRPWFPGAPRANPTLPQGRVTAMDTPFRISLAREASSGEDRTVINAAPRASMSTPRAMAREDGRVAVQDSGRHDRGEEVLLGEGRGSAEAAFQHATREGDLTDAERRGRVTRDQRPRGANRARCPIRAGSRGHLALEANPRDRSRPRTNLDHARPAGVSQGRTARGPRSVPAPRRCQRNGAPAMDQSRAGVSAAQRPAGRGICDPAGAFAGSDRAGCADPSRRPAGAPGKEASGSPGPRCRGERLSTAGPAASRPETRGLARAGVSGRIPT